MRILSPLCTVLVFAVFAGNAAAADLTLSGAGATFPEPLYLKWFQTFQERHPEIGIEYAAIGSGAGVDRLKTGAVDFAASDIPLSRQQIADFGTPLLQLPSVAGAVVPIYNLPRITREIRFTPEVLAGIYLGRITKWNDPAIRSANRDIALPNEDISVVHRQDASGTTFIWTDYLSKASPEWKAKAGQGTTVGWPVGRGAEQNAGVAAAVRSVPWSIGYVEWIYAIQSHLNFGSVRNSSGKFTRATLDSIGAAVSAPTAPAGYPIVSFTYLLVPQMGKDPAKATALRELLNWIFTSGQNQAAGLGYIALPLDVATRAAKSAANIR